MKSKLIFSISGISLFLFLVVLIIIKNEEAYLNSVNSIGCCENIILNNHKNSDFSLFVIKRRTKELIQAFLTPGRFFIKKDPIEYSFLISKNDKRVFDSLKIIALDDGILDDKTKKYRDVNLIFKDNSYKVKLKYRGSDPTALFWNSPSLKIKSKNPIDGSKDFNIVSGLEMDYKNIFFNKTGTRFGLYTEDIGNIVSVYFNKQSYDGFKYTTFNREYVKEKYLDTLYNQFKNYKNKNNHSSDFDNLYYNNEKEINKVPGFLIGFEKYKKFKKTTLSLNNDEMVYYSKYLALIYLFGNSHQITGDNLTLLDINHNLYPLFRNEGDLNYLNVNKESFDNVIFTYKEKADSYDFFKKLLTLKSFRKLRNTQFKKIVNLKHIILNDFDSIYKSNWRIHQMYDKRFFRKKLEYKLLRNNLISNFEKIENYLEFDKIYYIHESDTLYISSNSFTGLDVQINSNTSIKIDQREFEIDSEKKIRSKYKEAKIYFKGKIDSLTIFNEFNRDTLTLRNIYEK